MEPNGIITLLTDFGYRDGFVGTMKGVILGINPKARIVDISHGIVQGDIDAASFVLNGAYCYFPSGTIHTVVVDPGVGSDRRAIAAQVDDYFFVAPDNGVLSMIFAKAAKPRVYNLTKREYHLSSISHTFHGRDVFAPIAAHLSNGIPIQELGTLITDSIIRTSKQPQVKSGAIHGEIIYIDVFGNLITNISSGLLNDIFPSGKFKIEVGEQIIPRICSSYTSQGHNKLLAIINSFDLLEIVVRDSNAAKELKLFRGGSVKVKE